GTQTGEEDPLVPHLLTGVLGGPGSETGPVQGLVDLFRAHHGVLGQGTVDELTHLAEFDDLALLVQSGPHHAHPAVDPLRPETVDKYVQVTHAVEERHHHGVWPHGRGEVVHGPGQTAGLDREKDQVVGGGDRKSTRLNSSHVSISYAV